MPIQLKIPQPGDLITAAYMQDLVTALQNLDTRITSLESLVPGGVGQLAITDLQWPLGDLHIDDGLTIVGVNLGLQGETRVDFDGLASVTVFKPGSNEKKIILNVPAMPLGGPSKTIPLTVSNPRTGADSRIITVFQGLPTKPDGTINFAAPQFPQGTIIQPAADLIITFPLAIENLTMDAVFNISTSAVLLLSPQITMAAVALNDLNQQITTITLPKTDQPTTRSIKVKVTVPALPAGMTKADATVTVALSVPANPVLAPSSGMVPFTVGQDGPVSAFGFNVSAVVSPGSYDSAKALLHLPQAQTPAGGFSVTLKADLSGMTANEVYTVKTQPGDNHWTISGPGGFTLGNPGPQSLTYHITPSTGAPTTTLAVTITGTNPAHAAQRVFTLQPT